jgi:hypothetical protein
MASATAVKIVAIFLVVLMTTGQLMMVDATFKYSEPEGRKTLQIKRLAAEGEAVPTSEKPAAGLSG